MKIWLPLDRPRRKGKRRRSSNARAYACERRQNAQKAKSYKRERFLCIEKGGMKNWQKELQIQIETRNAEKSEA